MTIQSTLRRFRDAVTGKFVSKRYADKHQRTTVSERVSPYIPGGDRPVSDQTEVDGVTNDQWPAKASPFDAPRS